MQGQQHVLHIQHATIHLSASPATAAALTPLPIVDLGAVCAGPFEPRPAIGQPWHGQGGIYAGDMRGDDGVVYGLIVAAETDIGRHTWGPTGERDLSAWDGQANTGRLRSECPAAKAAAAHTSGGHADFYLPARRELQLAAANVPHLFGEESWYWTSTPYSEDYAWAVDFEDGYTTRNLRYNEFRVRPVRRFIY